MAFAAATFFKTFFLQSTLLAAVAAAAAGWKLVQTEGWTQKREKKKINNGQYRTMLFFSISRSFLCIITLRKNTYDKRQTISNAGYRTYFSSWYVHKYEPAIKCSDQQRVFWCCCYSHARFLISFIFTISARFSR